MSKRYKDKGYCSLCSKWILLKDAKKVLIPKLGIYAFYCPRHMKALRLKPRGKSMKSAPKYKGRN